MIKSKWQKAIKNYEATRLKSSLVFHIDNNRILGINTSITKILLLTRSSWIALALYQKRKRDIEKTSNTIELLNDIVFLASGFKKALLALTNIFHKIT